VGDSDKQQGSQSHSHVVHGSLVLGHNFISGSSNQPERVGVGFELAGISD
jgi:hypothetical protein